MAASKPFIQLTIRRSPVVRMRCSKCHRPLKRLACDAKFSLDTCMARKIVLMVCAEGHFQ